MPPKAPAKPAKETEEAAITPESILASELANNKESHLNYEDEVYYKVSTGSLAVDGETNGGVNPGVFVVSGIYEGGKTSFTLACMKNMLDTVPNSRGFYIKAEGRLSPEMRARVGINFVFGQWTTVERDGKKQKVFDLSGWKDGTCFVLETNEWEFTLNLMRKLVSNNPTKKRYFFFIDSMDGMSLKDDIEKDIGTANKVAGGPLLTKQFLQKMSNAMAKRGHICALAGQVSANIQIDPYAPAAPRSGPGGGGNAKDHWGNHIFVFKGKKQEDFILKDPKAKPDRDNPILGHWVNILIKKSPNEKSNMPVSYPVKYGRTEGRSVWVEREVGDVVLAWELYKKDKGSWYHLQPDNPEAQAAKEAGVVLREKVNGIAAIYDYMEEDKTAFDFLLARFKQRIIGGTGG